MDVPRPGPPNGFLLNLAAKHLSAFAVGGPPVASVEDIFAKAEHYGRAHDLSPSNTWEIHNRDLHSILPLIQELAAFDTLYQVPQFCLRDSSRALAHLFDWVPVERLRAVWGATADEMARLLLHMDAQLQHEAGPAAFTASDFSAVLPVDQAQQVLEAFAHRSGSNIGFKSPLQTDHMDAWTHPFFTGNGSFAILDARVAGNAFVECAAGLMRTVD